MIVDSFFFGGGFEIMFFVIFFLIIGVIMFNIIKGVGQWNKNNNSPRLTVVATIVSKRTQVSNRHHNNAGAHGSYSASSTRYYVTFQVESGDRIELQVKDSEYGFLVEGDNGQLSFQGSRYLSFERQYLNQLK